MRDFLFYVVLLMNVECALVLVAGSALQGFSLLLLLYTVC